MIFPPAKRSPLMKGLLSLFDQPASSVQTQTQPQAQPRTQTQSTSAAYATCRYIKTVGTATAMPSDVAEILRLHDEQSGAATSKPLA